MLSLLALPVFFGVAFAHRCLLLYAPSNLLIRRVRSTPPRWRVVAGLAMLAGLLVGSMHALADAVEAGAPGWLNLVVLVLSWDAFKISALALLVLIRRIVGTARSWLRGSWQSNVREPTPEEMWRTRDRQVPMGHKGEAWDVVKRSALPGQ